MNVVPVDKIPIGKPVDLKKIKVIESTLKKMKQVCKKLDGVGLSAVQIGIPLNLFIVVKGDFPLLNSEWNCFVNATYKPINNLRMDSVEGCLSLPNQTFNVKRWGVIELNGLIYRNGRFLKVDNYLIDNFDYGCIFQHEIDHQNGILINQIGKEI